jgi:hypothetical protein
MVYSNIAAEQDQRAILDWLTNKIKNRHSTSLWHQWLLSPVIHGGAQMYMLPVLFLQSCL